MKIPVVINHSGDDDYFKAVVIIAAQKNPVYIIGDEINADTFVGMDSIQHIHKSILYTQRLKDFEERFINYSSNSNEEELRCFRRVFLVHRLMVLKGYTQVFHLDSDCVLLEDISNIFPVAPAVPLIAYALMPNYHQFFMAGCIHNAMLSVEFCEAFSRLCEDIYINKSKFNLIAAKIEWHREHKVGGGICDMTMYYLLQSEKLITVLDLNQAFNISGEVCIFDHNINIEFGPAGDRTFFLKNGLKKVIRKNGKYYCETKSGEFIRAITLHFQGGAKKAIAELYAVGNA